MAALRKIRLHLEERNGCLRKAAKLMFTGNDASLYLLPYAAGGTYFYGAQTMGPGQLSDTFDFRAQLSASSNPKLSIHETGAVHIYAKGSPKAGPLQIPPLEDLRGQHIATAQWDAVELVPEMKARTRVTGAEQDWAFGVPDDVEAGALLLYVNGEEPAFCTEAVHQVFQVVRDDKPPLFFGLTAVQRDRLGDGGRAGGVTVLGGFNPLGKPEEPASYLYLRGI